MSPGPAKGGRHDVCGRPEGPRRRQPRDGARRLPRRVHRPRVPGPAAARGQPRRLRTGGGRRGGAGREPAGPPPRRRPGPRSGCSTTRAGTPSGPSTPRSGVASSTSWGSRVSWSSPPSRHPSSAGRDVGLLYAGAAAQNRAMGRFCSGDRASPAGGLRPPGRPRTGARPSLARRSPRAARPVMVPSTPAGDRAPTHPDLDPFWGTLASAGRALRPPRGRGRSAARPGLPQQRHAGHRPLGRRGEHPLEGLPGHPALARALPRDPHLRRPLRPVPDAAGRVHRAGGGVGGVVAAAPRLRGAGLPPHRGAAAPPASARPRSTCAGT